MSPHVQGLVAAYAIAATVFALLLWRPPAPLRAWWPGRLGPIPARPARQAWIAVAVVAMVPVIGGLAYGWLRTFERGDWRPIMIGVNQLVIFAPVLVLLARDPRGLRGAMLARRYLGGRLMVGAILSVVAVLTYAAVRPGAAAPMAILLRVWHPLQLPHLVQVFLEDMAVGLLLLRLADAFGARRAITVVAVLFAAGHVPAMLAGGAPLLEVLALVRDVGLGVLMGSVLVRSCDIAWFIPLHYTLDMTQFVGAA